MECCAKTRFRVFTFNGRRVSKNTILGLFVGLKLQEILHDFLNGFSMQKNMKNHQKLSQKLQKICEKLETTKMEVKNEPRERFLSNFGSFWVPLGAQERPKVVKKGVQEGMQKTVKIQRGGNQNESK